MLIIILVSSLLRIARTCSICDCLHINLARSLLNLAASNPMRFYGTSIGSWVGTLTSIKAKGYQAVPIPNGLGVVAGNLAPGKFVDDRH